MKQKRKILLLSLLLLGTLLFSSVTVSAKTITEAEVESQVASQGKEAVTGNVFIWFLCAIAFLKISQKIDGFMASLGINVGNTGGNMLSELLIAGRGLTGSFKGHGEGGYSRNTSPGSAVAGGSFLSGGLAGSVSRHMERNAVNNLTGHSDSGGFGNMLYQSSLKKGGDFSNQVIGDIAKGSYGQVGSIKGNDAARAFESYMGLHTGNSTKEKPAYSTGSAVGTPGKQTSSQPPVPAYSNMEIGGGKITGTETTRDGSKAFAMYNADQYMAPTKGGYETVKSVDGAAWYKQYAEDTVERKPYQKENDKVAYHESIVQKLPPTPPRKDRV